MQSWNRAIAESWRRYDKALEAQLHQLGDQLEELIQDIAHHQPTTVRGVAAILRYTALDNDEGIMWPNADDGQWRKTLHESLAAALERIARA